MLHKVTLALAAYARTEVQYLVRPSPTFSNVARHQCAPARRQKDSSSCNGSLTAAAVQWFLMGRTPDGCKSAHEAGAGPGPILGPSHCGCAAMWDGDGVPHRFLQADGVSWERRLPGSRCIKLLFGQPSWGLQPQRLLSDLDETTVGIPPGQGWQLENNLAWQGLPFIEPALSPAIGP